MKIYIILILISSIFLSGCVDNPKNIDNTKPVKNQHSSMSFTELEVNMASNDLTTLQKENLYVNKTFTWSGEVKDVTQNTVVIEIRKWVNYNADDVSNYYQKYCEYYNNDIKIRQSCSSSTIRLHINDLQKSQLNSLSKGSIITFEGTIIDKIYNWYTIDMYDGIID